MLCAHNREENKRSFFPVCPAAAAHPSLGAHESLFTKAETFGLDILGIVCTESLRGNGNINVRRRKLCREAHSRPLIIAI